MSTEQAEPQFDLAAVLKEIRAELDAIRAELRVLAQPIEGQSGVYEVELIEDVSEAGPATRQVPAQRQPGAALFSVGMAAEPTAIVLEQKSRRRRAVHS